MKLILYSNLLNGYLYIRYPFIFLVNNINMIKYSCNSCKYAKFVYTNKYKLKKIYCKKIGEYISVGTYRKLKYCLFYKNY